MNQTHGVKEPPSAWLVQCCVILATLHQGNVQDVMSVGGLKTSQAHAKNVREVIGVMVHLLAMLVHIVVWRVIM